MQWFALFAPELPLRAALGGDGLHTALADAPIVVSDGPEARPTLRAYNDVAARDGVMPGMGVGQARALCRTLTVLPRQCPTEDALLQAIATIALQWTPMVCIEPDRERHCVLMEVSASVKLFGGLRALAQALNDTFAAAIQRARFGAVYMGLAPTPLAAELFARLRASGLKSIVCLPHQSVEKAMAHVPITIVPWAQHAIAQFHALGLQALSEIIALPRAGVTKRFGADFYKQLDRCIARAPDPRIPFIPAAQFLFRLECAAPLEEGPHLLCGVEHALAALHDWLRARASGTRGFTVTLLHSRERESAYPVTLSELSCDPVRWRVLLIEHFQRKAVGEAVHAIRIQCDRPEPLANESKYLFAHTEIAAPDWAALIDRLHARLGTQAVYGLRLGADHRPELASTQQPIGATDAPYLRRSLSDFQAKTQPPRPTFLLQRPRALFLRDGQPSYQGALTLLSAPERIQSGWWDDAPVERDYFVARNEEGTLCWIFLALNEAHAESGAWYLHGFFC
jgi:protein ImuB